MRRSLITGWIVAAVGIGLIGSSLMNLQCAGCPCSCACVDFETEYLKFAIGVTGLLAAIKIMGGGAK